MARLITAPIAVVIVALLAGCAGAKTAADYAKMNDDTLCGSYGGDDGQRELARAEIDKRGLIPSYEWNRVSHSDVSYGMHYCAVLAAWHTPESKVGTGGAVEIWTFPDYRVVRFTNGAVVATTDFR